MKIPRDLSGEGLAKLVKKYGYLTTRISGSHIRLTTNQGGEHHITIPKHTTIKIGTLNCIFNEIAIHLKIDINKLIKELFKG